MAQTIVGTIPNFIQGTDDWNTYAEILEQFFVVNNIADDKKSAFLISCIGSDTYKTLRDLCHPILPKDKPFEELAEQLQKQFSPQVAIFRERSNFYNAKQDPCESVTLWYGRLKRLSVDCKFGDNLESILLDKFVTGLRTGQVLDRICEENESLTLQQALDIAANKECALKENGLAYTSLQTQQQQQQPYYNIDREMNEQQLWKNDRYPQQRRGGNQGRGGRQNRQEKSWRIREEVPEDQN